MKHSIRIAALLASVAFLSTSRPAPAHAAPRDDDNGPCQVYCDGLRAVCVLFKGGYLCDDMRDGCKFGCNLKVT